ncbi:hypothetical protein [Cellvibrio japonicus]|uniref:Lipoprotein n=2 Tax=Cellvibrio japonicus TaxID=155077 RepID=B3PET0_CELJU|nr:hypothetical protein [Cellvibrio japonicus]ACE86189.1 hypothetical protein CJA_1654 [Cellvibrio japonicus Ueda107]QEI12179.1 hypothetical protein FY117_08050 [Cellvibrio japonicus]QEI15753.1 hypothetical protein FY116_08055 [Cellvibrio japonicus]QEI19331.1 hypothetical protein FY115_08050 [Cellvibrio japonicus]
MQGHQPGFQRIFTLCNLCMPMVLAGLITACGAPASSENATAVSATTPTSMAPAKPSPAHPAKTVPKTKPGAIASLKDASPIRLEQGIATPAELELLTTKSKGHMRVFLEEEEPLHLVGEQNEWSFVLAPGEQYRIPVGLMAVEEGRFYLRLQVVIESDEGLQRRQLMRVVQVGEPAKSRQKPVSDAGDGVISLPAQETTITE